MCVCVLTFAHTSLFLGENSFLNSIVKLDYSNNVGAGKVLPFQFGGVSTHWPNDVMRDV